MTDILSSITIPGITWRKITDQIVTAIEGGINYWATSLTRVEDVKTEASPWYDDEKFWAGSFKVKLVHEEGETILTPDSILKGLEYLAKDQLWRIDQIVKETGDAETADVFMQACVFGDIVYG